METLGFAGAVFMGLILGLIGGGGSILAVPILAHLLKVPGISATYYSLLIVGISAAVGMLPFAKRGLVDFRTGLVFFLPAVAGVGFSRRILLPALPGELNILGWSLSKDMLILVAFGAVMIAAAWSMIRKAEAKAVFAKIAPLRVASNGIGVGLLSGFVGAGGGFLIVPALTNGLGLSMERAVGTSLLIIALNSLSGFGGDWITGLPIEWGLVLPFLAFALLGVAGGSYLNRFIPGRKLKPAFGWGVLLLGVMMISLEVIPFFLSG